MVADHPVLEVSVPEASRAGAAEADGMVSGFVICLGVKLALKEDHEKPGVDWPKEFLDISNSCSSSFPVLLIISHLG